MTRSVTPKLSLVFVVSDPPFPVIYFVPCFTQSSLRRFLLFSWFDTPVSILSTTKYISPFQKNHSTSLDLLLGKRIDTPPDWSGPDSVPHRTTQTLPISPTTPSPLTRTPPSQPLHRTHPSTRSLLSFVHPHPSGTSWNIRSHSSDLK